MSHPIENIPALTNYHVALRTLGYETLEDLNAAAQVAGQELSAYLRTPVDVLLNSLPVAAEAMAADALRVITAEPYALGVSLDNIPRPMIAPMIAPILQAAALAPNVNLVPGMPPIRDQGPRGTCVAHAALAAYEHFLQAQGAFRELSEQFLYWNCKSNDGIPTTDGTWLGVAFPLLKRDGCCPETNWEYNPTLISSNLGQGPPPGGAQLAALSFRLVSFKTLSPTSVSDIKAELARGRCVPFSIPVFNSWYLSTEVARTGDIMMPVPGEVRVSGHAMCLVGYADLPDRPELGGGRFLLRNSWGQRWGLQSPFGIGYGTIPYGYIARFGQEAYSIA